jgi:hypothetical protein
MMVSLEPIIGTRSYRCSLAADGLKAIIGANIPQEC